MNFVYRNSMLEIFFPKDKYLLSDYNSPLSDFDVDNYLWMNFLKPSPSLSDVLQQISELRNNLDISIKSSDNKPIYVLGLLMPKLYSQIISSKHPVLDEIYAFNKHILELSNQSYNINYLDPNDLLKYIGENYFSSKYYFSSSSVISPLCTEGFKKWLDDIEFKMTNRRKKLLILDLDNTLWGGVLGEDDYHGIHIGDTYPGNVYTYVQKKIKELSKQGIILSACSKNNFDDVKQVFLKNTKMCLKIDDFSIIKANWEEKSNNIKKILTEINIGEESCIFIDDNPFERDMVKSNFPEMIVPKFPSKLYDIPEFIDTISFKYFSSKMLIDEDLNKKDQYRIKILADKERFESSTKDEFLKNLELKGGIYKDIAPHISRISQMTLKTNQFNLTTMRVQENKVKDMINAGDHIFPLKVKDKYGDHGITGLIIASKTSRANEVDISNFLMSCRILGREIEYEFLKWCLLSLFKNGIKVVKASYKKTKRNIQVMDLYENAGFELIKEQHDQKDYMIILKEWLKADNVRAKHIDIKEVK